MVRARIWDIWRRAETGPMCLTEKFELDIFFPKVQELVKEYDIVYDPESLVPTDNTLIDDIYKAGMDLFLDVGVLCTDTERIMKFGEGEIKEMLKYARKEITLGEGKDAVILTHRKLEDKKPPIIQGGPIAAPISEEMAVKIYQSYFQEPVIDFIFSGTLETIEGVPVKAGSPFELHAELCNLAWMREAARRAGRPGIHLSGSSAVSVIAYVGATSPEYGWRRSDSLHAYLMPQLKTDYGQMSRAAHCMKYGCITWGMGTSFIGGLAGGPEGAAITVVAETLASYALYQLDFFSPWAPNALYPPGPSGRMSMWADFLAHAALNKNTDFAIECSAPYQAYAGPCTEMYLHEIAAATIGAVVVGSNPLHGGGRGGAHTDYCSGLDSRFMGEVAHAVPGMKREDANEIVKEILAKYEDRIKAKNPPVGKKFQECYNINTIMPSKEYLELYNRIKMELEDMGLTFKY